jgi:sphinganine-1-phosphate aldolase
MYAVADRLERRGWHVDRLQRPPSVHLIINPGHAKIIDQYLSDLREAVAEVKANPEAALDGTAPMYGLIAKAPMRRMVKRNVVSVLAQLYTQKETADLGEEDAPEAGGVPKPLLALMRLKLKLNSLFGRKK